MACLTDAGTGENQTARNSGQNPTPRAGARALIFILSQREGVSLPVRRLVAMLGGVLAVAAAAAAAVGGGGCAVVVPSSKRLFLGIAAAVAVVVAVAAVVVVFAVGGGAGGETVVAHCCSFLSELSHWRCVRSMLCCFSCPRLCSGFLFKVGVNSSVWFSSIASSFGRENGRVRCAGRERESPRPTGDAKARHKTREHDNVG